MILIEIHGLYVRVAEEVKNRLKLLFIQKWYFFDIKIEFYLNKVTGLNVVEYPYFRLVTSNTDKILDNKKSIRLKQRNKEIMEILHENFKDMAVQHIFEQGYIASRIEEEKEEGDDE